MTSSRPHLLTLPREVRNIIYSHMYQPINFDWSYKILPFPQDGSYTVPCQVRRAPLLSVLLSCTQIHDEYSQSALVQSMTIALDVGRGLIKHRNESDPNGKTHAKDIVRRTRHVELHMDTTDINCDVDSWSTIGGFVRIIHQLAPKLRTVEVNSGHGSGCNRVQENGSYLASEPVVLVNGVYPLLSKYDKLADYCDTGNDRTVHFPAGWKEKSAFYGVEGRAWLFECEGGKDQQAPATADMSL